MIGMSTIDINLSASWCRDDQVQATVEAALKEGSCSAAGLTYDDVARALEGRELDMTVEMPTDD